MTSSCEDGNEPSDPIKCGKCLGQLTGHQLLKKDNVPAVSYLKMTKR
jgi:hypothetical protein